MPDPKPSPKPADLAKAAPKLVDRKAAPPNTAMPLKDAVPPKTTASKPRKSTPKVASKPGASPAAASPAKKTSSKPSPKTPTSGKASDGLVTQLASNPEAFGEWLARRAAWIDEIVAILLIITGFIMLLALLSATPSVALANTGADWLRSVVGQVGGVLFAGMILVAGFAIVLPKIGIRVPLTWRRVIALEIGFVALLALLSAAAVDPEPRAFARAGGGGGLIGWSLSSPLQAGFGRPFTIAFFAVIMVIGVGVAFGMQRKHLREGVISARDRVNSTAEWLTRERPPRPPRPSPILEFFKRQQAERALRKATQRSSPTMAQPIPESRVGVYVPPTLVSQPPEPVIDSAPITADLRQTYLSATPLDPQPLPVYTPPPPLIETPPPMIPVIPERRRRYFTVGDFQEARVALPRHTELPPLDLLSMTELNRPTEQEINNNVRIIENTLLEFDIDVEVVDVKVGPTVTQYAVQPFREVVGDDGKVTLQRVRVNKVASLSSDLALALSAKTLRIQAYVPGFSYMGIEVPNRRPSTVALRPVMEAESFGSVSIVNDPDLPGNKTTRPLVVPLGRDVSGSAVAADLATMPHVLIAGTTGSGKSVCITALAVSLILNNHPDRVKLVMLDPKMVELTRFNGIPHLLGPVETEMDRIIGVLRWATREMDTRYKLLEGESARNIESYNRIVSKRNPAEKLPYLVILIDEIGDLMLTRPDETERTITRLAQMARAVGMHLVVATQRPSVDIITGLIKANFPSRISFAVATGVDSRVILDTVGAESLMGRGDMLFQAADAGSPVRLQGCYVSDEEVDAVVDYWRNWKQQKASSGEWSAATIGPWDLGLTRREAHSQTEPLLESAIGYASKIGEISTSMLQREFGIDIRHASHLLDLMQDLGILGATKPDGRTREVTLKPGTDHYRKIVRK
jgi:S-DNA-T family DNA segregation ATPase FtsK/SpoIIIE